MLTDWLIHQLMQDVLSVGPGQVPSSLQWATQTCCWFSVSFCSRRRCSNKRITQGAIGKRQMVLVLQRREMGHRVVMGDYGRGLLKSRKWKSDWGEKSALTPPRNNIPGLGTSHCKGPSAGQRRACLRNKEGLCHWGEGVEGVGTLGRTGVSKALSAIVRSSAFILNWRRSPWKLEERK